MSITLPDYKPEVPQNIEETGLREVVIAELILKHIFENGELSGAEIANKIGLPFAQVVQPVMDHLKHDKYIDIKGGGTGFGRTSMIFILTPQGKVKIEEILMRNAYVGPAPVSMNTYTEMVQKQSVRNMTITLDAIKGAFNGLIIRDYIFEGIGPAMNSGKAIFFYGPPGNGKTAVCERMTRCLEGYVFVPYAIEVDNNIIKIFDDTTHKPVKMEEDKDEDSILVNKKKQYDARWVLCERPLFMAGGELTLDMLDLSYSEQAKYYEAPFQLKANGGMLLIDDFGRQKVSPADLLNRWIVPLESEIDFLQLATGKKIKIPFDVFVVFSTNLEPKDLVDDAFLRRVRYKLEVKRPDEQLFKEIFELMCGFTNITYDEQAVDYMIEKHYKPQNRPFNACQPRDILAQIKDIAKFYQREIKLDHDLIDMACQNYFITF